MFDVDCGGPRAEYAGLVTSAHALGRRQFPVSKKEFYTDSKN